MLSELAILRSRKDKTGRAPSLAAQRQSATDVNTRKTQTLRFDHEKPF